MHAKLRALKIFSKTPKLEWPIRVNAKSGTRKKKDRVYGFLRLLVCYVFLLGKDLSVSYGPGDRWVPKLVMPLFSVLTEYACQPEAKELV